MSIILDLIVLAIIVLTVVMSARRGFVRVIIELAGFIAAIFITFTISTPLGNITYDKIIEPPALNAVEDITVDSASVSVETLWRSMPKFVQDNAEKLGISKAAIEKTLNNNAGSSAKAVAKTVSQEVVKPVVSELLALIYSVIVFILLLIAVKFLAKFLNRIFSFSVIGTLNRVLGGIVGIPKGIIIAILFCLIVALITMFTSEGFLFFSKDVIDKTVIFKFFSEIIPM